MKMALSVNGKPIKASEAAPRNAVCPCCGDTVVLRHRRLMNNGGASFFWRHLRNRNLKCRQRYQINR